ncbi:ubiquitin carboxyl-terminal hydrolase 14 isoform X2 [Gossypium hirsutum]|uniref:Ubiquitin carboxyl-terminal hydrolase 14 isoform X2 n=1 Tax=Gossypium hirsutum TaxID=3635 RepID=A0ABM3ACU4_GOSHI|nr:ubiquitin carboxyl-terminal hydrolase 14-like isoform X2 [Gossypium hirsutum]
MFYGKEDFINCVDGGFDNNELEYEETHKIVILPSYANLPFASMELPEKGLTKLLADNAPKAMKEQKLESYFGRKIAIDASMSIYQFLVDCRLWWVV